jgi:hypothetical protein
MLELFINIKSVFIFGKYLLKRVSLETEFNQILKITQTHIRAKGPRFFSDSNES